MSKFSTTAEAGKILRLNNNKIIIPGERWYGGKTHDFLEFGDWITYIEEEGPWMINGCLRADLDAHIQKAFLNAELKRLWTDRGFGAKFFVWENREEREEGNTDFFEVVFSPANKKGGK